MADRKPRCRGKGCGRQVREAGTFCERCKRTCSVCRAAVGEHRRERCEVCGRALEHHAPGDIQLEWEGRARMAAAKRAADLELTEVEERALARHPVPGGYVAAAA